MHPRRIEEHAIHGSRVTKDRAKALRRRMSLPEALLWRGLKSRKLLGLHFRKQHPCGLYVLDFYCDAVRLAVEVDGAGHGAADRWAHDQRRDSWLKAQGIQTLRIRAAVVLGDVDNAIGMIAAFVVAQGEAPSLQPPPALRTTSP